MQKRHLYWLGVAILIAVSAVIAVVWNDSDAVREMATGAFAGGIIGAVLLVYEEWRDDERDERALERDRKHARQLRSEADWASDLRAFAAVLIGEIEPELQVLRLVPKCGGSKVGGCRHCDAYFRFVASNKKGQRWAERLNQSELHQSYVNYQDAAERVKLKNALHADLEAATKCLSKTIRLTERLISQEVPTNRAGS